MTGLADTGRVIAGRYRLQAPIGRGAMGVVWRARDELLDRDVAVKEVQVAETLTEDERANAYERTLREAKTAARLSHPAVVSVFDVASEDGRPWIVMELINSRSLDQVLAASGPMPARSVAEIGRQLLSALSVAHAAGVLHRDVKPSNVLIASDGRAVLTDFGIATFQGDPKLTATGMVMGSPGFTAPERIRGGDATPASDLWSLGATLYAAVEGRGPYEARGGAFTTMSAVINEDAPAAPSAGPLGPVIASLLRREPAERPDAVSAARMISDVLPVLSDRGASGGGYQPTAVAARPEAARPEPGRPEPGRPEPGRPEPGRPESGRREPGRPEPGRPEPGRPEMTQGSAPGSPVPTMRQPGSEATPPDFSSWYSTPSGDRSGSAWSAYQSGPPASAAGPVRQGGQQPSRPASDYGGGYGPSRRGSRGGRGGGGARWVLVLVILALLGAAAGVTAVVLLRHNSASGSPGTSSSTPPVSSSGPASPSASGGGGAGTADPLASAINRQPAGAVPAGYLTYQRTGTDAGTTAGFSIGYPSSGWTKSDNGVNSVLRLSAATYTRVDLTTHTYPNDMLAEARYIRDASMVNHPGYHEIALGRMTIRGASGAYWEFTWDDNGVTEQWLDLVWVANTPAGPQSYALLFAAPQSAWTQMSSTFASQAQSFQTKPS